MRDFDPKQATFQGNQGTPEARFLSNHFVIEIRGNVLRYKPRLQSRMIPWLTAGLIPLIFPGWLTQSALAQGELDMDLVTAFQADPGWPVLGSPSISLAFLDRDQPQSTTFFFQRYFVAPNLHYGAMIQYLGSFGIREESKTSNRVLRSLSWLFVPIAILIGWLLAKSDNGFVALYGAVLLVLGVFLVCGSLIEGCFRLVRAILARTVRR